MLYSLIWMLVNVLVLEVVFMTLILIPGSVNVVHMSIRYDRCCFIQETTSLWCIKWAKHLYVSGVNSRDGSLCLITEWDSFLKYMLKCGKCHMLWFELQVWVLQCVLMHLCWNIIYIKVYCKTCKKILKA